MEGGYNMDFEMLYKKQAELDKHILENNDINMGNQELLDNTILALLVEVGELANTTRCFKHWSKKGMMEKDIVLDELADVWHFYLSIGNQLGVELTLDKMFMHYEVLEVMDTDLSDNFLMTYIVIGDLADNIYDKSEAKEIYLKLGTFLVGLYGRLEFSDSEVTEGYLKKHEENYRRQREGY